MSYTKFGPDGFSRLLDTNGQTDRQNKFIYRYQFDNDKIMKNYDMNVRIYIKTSHIMYKLEKLKI